MFPSRVEVFAHTCCLRTNATLRIKWTFSPKRVQSRKWGNTHFKWIWTVSKEGHNIYIYVLHIHRWYMGVYVYIYIYVNPESLRPLKRIDMFLWFFDVWKEHAKSACVFFFGEKMHLQKIVIETSGMYL